MGAGKGTCAFLSATIASLSRPFLMKPTPFDHDIIVRSTRDRGEGPFNKANEVIVGYVLAKAAPIDETLILNVERPREWQTPEDV